jgi:hypothetical protein
MKKILLIIIIFFYQTSFGQKKKTLYETSTFLAFDTIYSSLRTDKIVFLKDNSVDILKSKPYLDSLVLSLSNNPTIVVEVCVIKGYDLTRKYRESPTGQKQAQSLVDYFVKEKDIPPERIRSCGIYCGQVLITEEDLRNTEQKKKDITIRTNIRIINKDFRPK